MSLARRTLRTTAAAAGIAVLGVGLGGTAFAAPEAPESPAPESTPSATTDSTATEGMLTKVANAPTSMSDLPTAFTFENPSLNTSEPTLPDAAQDDTAVNPRSVDPSSSVENLSVEQSQVGALANMDTAKAMSELAG